MFKNGVFDTFTGCFCSLYGLVKTSPLGVYSKKRKQETIEQTGKEAERVRGIKSEKIN